MGANDPSTRLSQFDPSSAEMTLSAQCPDSAGAAHGTPCAAMADGRASIAVTGRIAGFAGGQPLVLCGGDGPAVVARSIIDLHAAHLGKEVVLLYDGGNALRPIIVGLIVDPHRSEEARNQAARHPESFEVLADGERLVVSARNQLVLRCGAASITLTAAGKVLIHGKYVSSRAEGVNRVKGGSVHLN